MNFQTNDQVLVRTPMARGNRIETGRVQEINGAKATVKMDVGGRTATVALASLEHVSSRFGQTTVNPNPAMRGNRIYLRK